jgi:hypothetical protein
VLNEIRGLISLTNITSTKVYFTPKNASTAWLSGHGLTVGECDLTKEVIPFKCSCTVQLTSQPSAGGREPPQKGAILPQVLARKRPKHDPQHHGICEDHEHHDSCPVERHHLVVLEALVVLPVEGEGGHRQDHYEGRD